MAKHLPTHAAQALVPRVMHYPDPATRPDLVLYTTAQLAERRREQQALYARWAERQAAIAEQDRKLRRFWLGFGAIVGTAVLAVVALVGWLAYHAVTTTALGLLAVPLVLLVLAGVVLGGRRCITIVQHWH